MSITRLSNANNVKDYEPLLAEYHTSWEDIIVKNKNILLDIEAPAFLNDRDSFGWKGVQK